MPVFRRVKLVKYLYDPPGRAADREAENTVMPRRARRLGETLFRRLRRRNRRGTNLTEGAGQIIRSATRRRR